MGRCLQCKPPVFSCQRRRLGFLLLFYVQHGMCLLLPLHFYTFKSRIKRPTRNIIKITHVVFLMKARRHVNHLLLLEWKRSSDAETLSGLTLCFSHVNTAKTKSQVGKMWRENTFSPTKVAILLSLEKRTKNIQIPKENVSVLLSEVMAENVASQNVHTDLAFWWPSIPCRSPEDTCFGQSSLI